MASCDDWHSKSNDRFSSVFKSVMSFDGGLNRISKIIRSDISLNSTGNSFSFTSQPEVSSIRCWQTNDKKTHTLIINVIVTNTKQEGKFPMNQKLDLQLPWSRMKLRWNFSCIWSTSPVSNRLRLETSFHFLAFLVQSSAATSSRCIKTFLAICQSCWNWNRIDDLRCYSTPTSTKSFNYYFGDFTHFACCATSNKLFQLFKNFKIFSRLENCFQLYSASQSRGNRYTHARASLWWDLRLKPHVTQSRTSSDCESLDQMPQWTFMLDLLLLNHSKRTRQINQWSEQRNVS